MRTRASNLFRWDGTIDRGPYLVLGVGLLLLKHLLDWLVATMVFQRSWSPFNYFVVPGNTVNLLKLPELDRWFYGTLLALALPFIFLGVLFTVQRLRSARLPAWLVGLFFIPLINLSFFMLLCVLPGLEETDRQPAVPDTESASNLTRSLGTGRLPPVGWDEQHRERWRRVRSAHQRITRDSTSGSAAVSLAICVPLALGFVFFGASALGNYGWGLFVGMPFGLGLASVVLFGLTRPQPLSSCLGVASLALLLVGAGILVFAIEGLICLLMAAPIGFALTLLGGLIGYAIQSRPWSNQDNPTVLLVLFLTLPSLTAAESINKPEPALLEVCSVVEIDAPPEVVWRQVIAFPDLPEPAEWYFRTGIAYPRRAEIHGQGVGAERHCIFSTGTFVEPIEVWDEPRLLRFRVADQPCPMVEWSPFDIHPPHLDHYLVSQRGEFRLIALPDGRTRLEGTTWYTNRMWPARYWQLWSDAIIHRIHLRVLQHIKGLAEQEMRK